MDEMANAMKDLDAAVKEHDLAPNTDGSFNAGETEIADNFLYRILEFCQVNMYTIFNCT